MGGGRRGRHSVGMAVGEVDPWRGGRGGGGGMRRRHAEVAPAYTPTRTLAELHFGHISLVIE